MRPLSPTEGPRGRPVGVLWQRCLIPPLPRISGAEAVRALERGGFIRVGQKGSHVKLRNGAGRVVIVPMHAELAAGTLRSIIRQAGLTVEAFLDLL